MRRILLIPLCFVIAVSFGQTNWTINASGMSWSPNNLTIQQGDSVTWINSGPGIHNINGTTATYPSNPESFGNLSTGNSWTYGHRFNIPGTYSFRCDVHASNMTGTLTVNSSAGIEDVQRLSVTIGPNPASTFLSIKCNEAQYTVNLYDMLGNKVLSKKMESNETLDISKLNSGLYWIEINTENGSYKKKWIKR